MLNHFKRSLFDRYDGWRVKNVDAVFAVIPFIMRTRLDAQNTVEESINLDRLNEFIRQHKQDIPGISTMHVIMAAFVRIFSQMPALNRFVVWNKIFARNSITISLMVKRSLSEDGEETLVKTEFDPADTLADVVKKLNAAIEASKPTDATNDMDKVARWFRLVPAWLVRILISIVRMSDNLGIMPRFIEKASPFHCSLFVTNMASLRCKAIYHHLYEFGTCSLFCAIGRPEHSAVVNGREIKPQRTLQLKFTTDERIADGYYFANGFRMLSALLNHPEQLLTPPETVIADKGVGRKRIDL